MTITAPRPTAPVQTMPATATRRRRVRTSRVFLYISLYVITFIIVTPLVWVVLTSFRTDFDVVSNPGTPIPNPFTLDAYETLLTSGQQPIFRWLANSLVVAVAQTALILTTSALGAYALARLDFRGKNVIFGIIVATLLVPPVILLIPNYIIVESLGWLDTLWAVIIPGSASAFGIFFLRQFFLGLPHEYEEAARVDGAGDLRIFLQIVLPLSRPALATLAVLSFLASWNDFLWPIYVLLSTDNLTLQPGLSILQGAFAAHYGVIMAGAVIAAVPVLILFTIAQKQVVESVAGTGVKG